jgi:hypothetical protein
MATAMPNARKKTQRVGDILKLDNVHAMPAPEVPGANPQGVLRNFLRPPGGAPGWGSLRQYDNLANLKALVPAFKVDAPGSHTVVLVYFDKGTDGVFRFVQVVADDIQVNP